MQGVQSTEAGSASVPGQDKLLDDLCGEFRSIAAELVPWFVDNMPRMYFLDTTPAAQRAHLRAILAARASGRPVDTTFRSSDGSSITAIRSGNRTGILAEVVSELPLDASLRAAKIHTSRDGSLIIDTFEFGEQEPFDPTQPRQCAAIDAAVEYAALHHPTIVSGEFRTYLAGCSSRYLLTLTPLRMCRHFELFRTVSGTELPTISLETEDDPTVARITLAVSNARTRTMLERAARVLQRHDASVVRAHLDVAHAGDAGRVTFIAFIAQWATGSRIESDDPRWLRLRHELLRVKWLDFRVIEFVERHPMFTVPEGELVAAFADLVRHMLVPADPLAFTRDRVTETLAARPTLTKPLLELFRERFDPAAPLPATSFAARAADLEAQIGALGDSDDACDVFGALLKAIRATLRTNFFVPNRFSLTLRLAPELMQGPTRPEIPFGVFFVYGRGFHGFHVRFKEIARGGLRIVKPSSAVLYDRESERLYDEVYGLSFAQQLKNKDIPEGGAKAAIVLEPPAEATRCVKAFVDGILDLITPEPSTRRQVVDLLGFDEFIYLGPDENITPAHIEWIVDRAGVRSYPLANAFMSSKPNGGINHKEFGVTSEGVNVFLRTALLARGIDPNQQPFTVKITGGPDGDVAGNMMRILSRDYGNNARIVGVADGSGIGEDPKGLDHGELLRLFQAGLAIAHFDPARLSSQGRIVSAATPEGVQLRNTLHNRLVTDAFVPGGGRPATINERNWREYLQPDGRPSSPLIVEGANLFLTPQARNLLAAAGATIFKDSSANKCGVICSSFEIASSMLMSETQFLAIKPRFVDEVLRRLREIAQAEAVILLAESRRHPSIPLPELSTRLSRAINAGADAIKPAVTHWRREHGDLFREVVLQHLPSELYRAVGERVFSDLPVPYLEWMVAKSVASNLVYREGIDFFASMDGDAIASVALRYLQKSREIQGLVAQVRASGLASAAEIAALLERAGTRAALLHSDK
jgi:glutamate dehydrogenase